MTHLLLIVSVYLFPAEGGDPTLAETFIVETYAEGYMPDEELAELYNHCHEMARETIRHLQMGSNQNDALLPGANETIRWVAVCTVEI